MQDELVDLEEEELGKMRQNEVMFEKIYEEVYNQRQELMLNKLSPEIFAELVEEFNEHILQYKDDLKKVEHTPCNVQDTLNLKKEEQGVANFWLRAIMNHPNLSGFVNEKDRVILQSLLDIKVTLHEDYGFGFDIRFTFEDKNPYFLESVLSKKFVMTR